MCQIPEAVDKQEISTACAKEFIRDAVNLNPASLVFSGGEPLLRNDIFELISFTNSFRVNTCLTSNGTLIDDAIARKLASSGIGVVNISIDGPMEIHDSLRGKGAFEKAVCALENLKKHKIESTIATIVCRQNYKYLSFVVGLAQRFGVTTVKFQPFSDIFLLDKQKGKDFFVSAKERNEIQAKVEEVQKLSNKFSIAINPAGYLRHLPDYLTGCSSFTAPISCQALWRSCPISSEGDVHPCWVLSDSIIGNIKSSKLSEIWNSRAHQDLRKEILSKGCPPCFMSCYDYNFGDEPFSAKVLLKVHKLKKKSFYKRSFNRSFQHSGYLFKKIANRLFRQPKKTQSEIQTERESALFEINLAKELLQEKIEVLNAR
jgi:MoaA/NifB/PqqE/SkfB family radical SAM enzyme